jgi:peptide/nickel transport system substrate-binding protein
MSAKTRVSRFARREFLKTGAVMIGAAAALPVLAACGQETPVPAKPVAATTKPTEPAKPAATTAPSQALATDKPRDIPRNRTLMVMQGGVEGKHKDHELWNPYAVGSNHQTGSGIFYEPLAYYSAFQDKEYLWLAESYKYSADLKELTIKTRQGINWSDGKPFSAEDVAFTLNTLRELGPKVRWGVDVQRVVEDVKATDSNTVVVKFKVPAPRFFFFMSYKYDIGVYIVPKHIFQGQDWTSFKHFDVAKGWPVTTGPWKVVHGSPEQKIVDRRDEWWAAKAGLAPMPRVLREVRLPMGTEQQLVQSHIKDELDFGWIMSPPSIQTIVQQNPKVITFTGNKTPFAYKDWYPQSIFLNCERAPFDDKEVRWAVSYFIDRKQVVDVGYGGAGSTYPMPYPAYPPLDYYTQSIKDLLEKYPTLEFNPKKGEEILLKKGWKKDGTGFWLDAKGQRVKMDIITMGSNADIGPVVAEQLRRQGFDTSFALPPDVTDRFSKGEYTAAIFGHGGSVRDPYDTLRLYQSSSTAVPGGHQVNFSRWKNDAYDKIVDEIYATDPSDKAKLTPLFRKAMEIWLPELPDPQLVERYHRIAMNTTYWKGWPTEQDPYITGNSWHLTYAMILWRLDPVQ